MHNGLKYVFIFSVGVAVGAVATHQILKPKYEKMVQDEVNDFKKDWSDRQRNPVDGYPEIEDEQSDVNSVPELKSLVEENNNIIENERYAKVLEKGGSISMNDDDPYVISPLKFAEGCDYDTVSLTYYKEGGYLVDELGVLVEDIASTVGLEFVEHFGEYTDDPDTVYVRNDRLEIDYEIQLDIGTYLNPTANE